MLPFLNELRRLPHVLGLVALAVRYSTRQTVRVALASACRALPRQPVPSLTRPSALACSFVMRVVRSLWAATSSWIYVALRFTSRVRYTAFFASTHNTSWTAQRLQTSLKELPSLPLVASCAAQQSGKSLVAVANASLEQSRSSCRRLCSFRARSSSSAQSRVAAGLLLVV